MKTLAVLVLVLVWVGLFAMWIRSRAQDGDFSDPVGTFNRHLRVLGNASPSRARTVNPHRPASNGAIAPYRPSPSAGLGPMTDPRRVRPPAPAARRRAQTQKRRRDVFFALLAGMVGSLILGLIPGLRVMLYFQGVFDVLFVLYCGALISMKNRAAERDAKLAYLSSARPGGPSGYAPARRGHAVGYASGYDDTYGEGYSYAELAVRRAAN